jgi:hypothetical protein
MECFYAERISHPKIARQILFFAHQEQTVKNDDEGFSCCEVEELA